MEAGTALMQPFLAAARVIPEVTVGAEAYANEVVNDLPFQVDDAVGENYAAGSRLIPEATYRDKPEAVGPAYQELLEGGALKCVYFELSFCWVKFFNG
jgi:hypothetical protein